VGRRIVIGTAYAATETTAAVMMRTWAATETSCIGVPLPGCELKLIPDPAMPNRFELRVRGANVFGRYLGPPEISAAAFDDEGFYRLGDAVRFLNPKNPVEGLLFAGRFAEDFKLGNGSWVRTAAVRARLMAACAPLLREVVIAGEGRDRAVALAWPDFGAFRAALNLGVELTDSDLTRHPAVLDALADRLTAFNDGQTASTSRVEALALLLEPASMEAYELTDKGSINQRAVVERRSAAVEQLYILPTPPSHVVTPRKAAGTTGN
jgi:feruloyl-CoA synthase